jgi:hypothetical protein
VLPGGEGSEKLVHAVPVGDDPVQVNDPLRVVDDRAQRRIVFLGINPVDLMAMQAPDARTQPFAKHRKGHKIQFDRHRQVDCSAIKSLPHCGYLVRF